MTIFQAIVLGIVQGFSEFLPISSSGHLILTRWLFGWNEIGDPSVEKAVDVALHFGTLAAVLGYFWRDLLSYVVEGVRLIWRREKPVSTDGRIAWLLVVATIPAAAIGFFFEDAIDDKLGTPFIIAISLIVFGVLMWWADRQVGERALDKLNLPDSIKLGVVQALALNPGTSRSGITITGARALGFDRDAAARLSFLLSVPVVGGAVVLKLGGLLVEGVPAGLGAPLLVGIVASAISGWIAVWGTMRLIRTRSFTPFVIYRIVIGVVILAVVV